MKVDFFIVGAPKAGTTSLYNYLNEHPEIVMSTKKETDYFSNESIEKQGMYYEKKRIIITYKKNFRMTIYFECFEKLMNIITKLLIVPVLK